MLLPTRRRAHTTTGSAGLGSRKHHHGYKHIRRPERSQTSFDRVRAGL